MKTKLESDTGSNPPTCSASSSVAIVRRKEYPQNYLGHNEYGPMWSSSLANAKRVPVADVQAIIDKMSAEGMHAWGEIHPHNDQVEARRK